MLKFGVGVAAGLCLVALAGCERSSAVARDPAGEHRASTPILTDDREAEARGSAPDSGGDRGDAAVAQIDGKPIWSSSRRGSAEENAKRSFDRNGQAFGARTVEDYVRKARAFVEHPPAGTERLKRPNGDELFYDPKANVFAVATRDGVPRAMFKPDGGPTYWDQQKTQEAPRGDRRGD